MPKKRNHGDGGLHELKSRRLWRAMISCPSPDIPTTTSARTERTARTRRTAACPSPRIYSRMSAPRATRPWTSARCRKPGAVTTAHTRRTSRPSARLARAMSNDRTHESAGGHTTSKNAPIGPRNSTRRNHTHADRFRVRANPPARIATVNHIAETKGATLSICIPTSLWADAPKVTDRTIGLEER